MKKKLFCTASLWLFSCLMVMADYVPTAYYTVEGEDLESTDFITDAEAPLTVTFKANPSDLGELTPAYEWRFYKDGQLTPFLVRKIRSTSSRSRVQLLSRSMSHTTRRRNPNWWLPSR